MSDQNTQEQDSSTEEKPEKSEPVKKPRGKSFEQRGYEVSK